MLMITNARAQVYLAPATLRPETMYGQTNCFLLPEGVYGAYAWADGDVLIMSARGAKGLAHQGFAREWGQVGAAAAATVRRRLRPRDSPCACDGCMQQRGQAVEGSVCREHERTQRQTA
jgi:hypothetical protein